MVQLQVLSGRATGTLFKASAFPCAIGRARDCELPLEEPGIWERHLELDLHRGEGVLLRLLPPALATVNGQPFDQIILRNGDLIEAGGIKLRFSLSGPRQGGHALREALTWIGLAALCALQLFLIHQLTR